MDATRAPVLPSRGHALMELIDKWKVQDALEMYGVRHWGKGYFSINERGHVMVDTDLVEEREDGVPPCYTAACELAGARS